MDCFESRKLIPLYEDGELDALQSAALDSHLLGCATCAAAVRAWRAGRADVVAAMQRHGAPAALVARVEAIAEAGAPAAAPFAARRGWRAPSFWWPAAAGFALGLLLATGGMFAWQMRSNDGPAVQAAVTAHVRSLLAENHLTDVESTDRHTVRPWFAGRLDFSPPVVDLAINGYPLIGGRLDYVDNRPAAALVYRARKHVINVFIARRAAVGEVAPASLTRDGFGVVRWARDGFDYVAVSDLNVAELGEFAALLVRAP